MISDLDDFDIDDEDAVAIGRKVAEMADRAKAMDAILPGAQATWHFEVDDIRFKVVVAVEK